MNFRELPEITERQLAGHEFVIHLQPGLLAKRSTGKDFNSFTIPTRFIVQSYSTQPFNFLPGQRT